MRFFILPILLLQLNISSAQNDSLLIEELTIKKLDGNIFSINVLANYPFLLGGESLGYKNKNGSLVRTGPRLEYGIRLNYAHLFSGQFSFGMEAGLDVFHIYPWVYAGGGLELLRHERIQGVAYSIMPKIEFKRKKRANIPSRFCSQFGLGLTFIDIIDNDYLYEWQAPNGFNDPVNPIYNYKDKPYIGLSLLYGMNYRIPLTEKWLIDIGTRFTVNILIEALSDEYKDPFISPENDQDYWITRMELASEVNAARVLSFLDLNLGVTYRIN